MKDLKSCIPTKIMLKKIIEPSQVISLMYSPRKNPANFLKEICKDQYHIDLCFDVISIAETITRLYPQWDTYTALSTIGDYLLSGNSEIQKHKRSLEREKSLEKETGLYNSELDDLYAFKRFLRAVAKSENKGNEKEDWESGKETMASIIISSKLLGWNYQKRGFHHNKI